MSKIFENKSMLIHLAVESVIILAITFYFSQKNKKLMGHINDLIERIEEQEDIIQKHEQLINNLSNAINDINYKISGETKNVKKNNKQSENIGSTLEETLLKHIINPELNNTNNIKMHFIPPPLRRSTSQQPYTTTSKIEEIDGSEDMDVVETILENDDEDKDENLDAELEEELSELN
jgi:hypothetical protein